MKTIEIGEKSEKRFAYYNYKDKKIKIYRDTILESIDILSSMKKYKNSMYTALIVNDLYHELTHAYQHRIICTEGNSLRANIFYDNFKKYSYENYYNLSVEVNAIIIAYVQMMKILSYGKKFLFIRNSCNEFISDFLTLDFIYEFQKFYEEESPVERMNIDLSEYNYNGFDNYEKILLGLPIDINAQRKVLSLDIDQTKDLKKYMN